MRSISFAATATATALAAATAGVGLLVTAPGAASADATKSSAYGLQASGGGEVIVPPTPYVESTDGTNKTAGGGSLPANPLGVSATIGELSAGDDFASVELTDLGIAPSGDQIPAELQAALDELQAGCEALAEEVPDPPPGRGAGENEPVQPVPARCRCRRSSTPSRTLLTELLGGFTEADLEDFCECFDAEAPLVTARALSVECQGDIGKFELIGVEFLGQEVPLPSPVEPNTAILPENPLLTITANQQTKNDDGSFSIDGLNVQLAEGEAEAHRGQRDLRRADRGAGDGHPGPAGRSGPGSGLGQRPGHRLIDPADRPAGHRADLVMT